MPGQFKKEDFVVSEIGGTFIAVPVGSASGQINGVIRMNGTGRFIWDKIFEGLNRDDIARLMTEEYDVDLDKAKKDVQRMMERIQAVEGED